MILFDEKKITKVQKTIDIEIDLKSQIFALFLLRSYNNFL